MVWEFPAVSHTRIKFWKEPQYTQSGMWWFTLFFGFFGLHHFLLRSPQTGFIFLICNILTCGYLWLYDLIQLSKQGGVDTEELNKHGLSYAFGALGLAQGMWKTGDEPVSAGTDAEAPPNPLFFLAYSLLIPISPVAQYVAGDGWTSFLRLLYITVIPFGTLLYMFSILSDYWTLFSQPSSLFFTMSKKNLAPFLDILPCPPADNILITILRFSLPILRYISPGFAELIESMINTVKVVKEDIVEAGIQKAKQVTNVANKVGRLTTEIPAAVAGPFVKAASIAANPMAFVDNLAPLPPPPLPQPLQQQPPLQQQQQKGGSRSSNTNATPLEYLTLGTLATVIGGGLLLGINRSIHRYAVTGKDDSPPDAGRV